MFPIRQPFAFVYDYVTGFWKEKKKNNSGEEEIHESKDFVVKKSKLVFSTIQVSHDVENNIHRLN